MFKDNYNEGLEQEDNDFRFRIFEKIEDKKPYETEKYRDYFFINHLGKTWHIDIYSKKGAEKIYKRGLTFKTVEEAEQYDKERILLFKMHKWAEEHNEDWTPSWKNKGTKYHISYEMEQGFFNIEYCVCYNPFTKLPYFKSEKIAKKFIGEFGKEIKEVFCLCRLK